MPIRLIGIRFYHFSESIMMRNKLYVHIKDGIVKIIFHSFSLAFRQ